MKTNVGSYDCAARFVAGCIAMLIGNHYLTWWGLIGLVPILSAIAGFCPLYALFSLDTTACDDHEHRMEPRAERAPRRVTVGGAVRTRTT